MAAIAATALSACLAAAASQYHVQPVKLQEILRAPSASAQTVGAAHIPVAWLPILATSGFEVAKIDSDPCISVAAAAWIVRYSANVEQMWRRWKLDSHLPARAMRWQPTVRYYSQAYGIDPQLANALIMQESGFHSRLVSNKGAIGLTQLVPGTAKQLGVDPHDPTQNIAGGIAYLSELLRTYHGSLPLALAAYNAGPGAVAHYGGVPPYRETRKYVPEVMTRYEVLAKARGQPAPPRPSLVIEQ